MDVFLLDGQSFRVHVTKLTRKFALLDARKMGRTMDGGAYREVVGTLYHYEMTLAPIGEDTAEMDRLWEILSQPAKSHMCTFPYGQSTLTQRMYVQAGAQDLRHMSPGANRWGEITLEFTAMAPEVMP